MIPYLAGYIDGDGCFYIGKTIQKPKNIIVYERSIQVVSVVEETLQLFQHNYGGSVRARNQRAEQKITFCWTIKNEEALSLAQKLYHFLTDKQSQCEIFIDFCQLIWGNNFKTVENHVIDERDKLIEKIRYIKTEESLIDRETIEAFKGIHPDSPLNEEEIAYFAGLIDSEGCLRIKKFKPSNRPNYTYHVALEIGNTRMPILTWLMFNIGGSVSFIVQKNNKKDSFSWTIASSKLNKLLPIIEPHLINKQLVCKKIMEFQMTVMPNGGDRHSETFKKHYALIQIERERIVSEVHALNRKGFHK